ncbi:hypothetical protein D3C78_1251930 [compost metagenome]
MLVASAHDDVSRQHAVPADIDARRLIHQQVGPLDGGIRADTNMLPLGIDQIDLAGTEAHVRSDLDQVVLPAQADLAVRQGDVLANHQTVVAPAQLDRDLLQVARAADRQLQAVARTDHTAVLVEQVVQAQGELLQHRKPR